MGWGSCYPIHFSAAADGNGWGTAILWMNFTLVAAGPAQLTVRGLGARVARALSIAAAWRAEAEQWWMAAAPELQMEQAQYSAARRRRDAV